MGNPKISIITVSFNSKPTIEETIQSVLHQNYDNVEYIIIDGGSTDGTTDIIRKYENSLAYWCSEKDRGISDAFNKGISHATGDVVGIINSDDVLVADSLMHLAQVYSEDTDVYRGINLIVNKETGMKVEDRPSMTFPLIAPFAHIAHPSTFVARKAYERFGTYDINLHYNMDHDLLLRMYRAGAKFQYVDYVLSEFRLGGETSTPITKKKHDMKVLITNNGGTNLQANLYYSIMYAEDLVKRILQNTIGMDRMKRLHHIIKK